MGRKGEEREGIGKKLGRQKIGKDKEKTDEEKIRKGEKKGIGKD